MLFFDSVYVKAIALALIVCGLWFVFLTAKSALAKVWPKITSWLVREETAIKSEIAALESRIAALEGKTAAPVAAPVVQA